MKALHFLELEIGERKVPLIFRFSTQFPKYGHILIIPKTPIVQLGPRSKQSLSLKVWT